MSPAPRLPVILLWHMHQPQYRDALTGQYVLPWTYLHAVKDYTDMAAHLESNREARAVVNFSPLLIEQIEDIASRIAEHLKSGAALPDPMLALLGPGPVPTEAPLRLELLRACLRAQRRQMIERFGPYLELATIAETLGTPERIGYASDQFIHDLAVWYHLAWLGAPRCPSGCTPERSGARFQPRAAPRAPDAHRRSRRAGVAALPCARRQRPV